MNSMNDESFFDLAMKVIGGQASEGERAKLESMLAENPELRAEFSRAQTNASLVGDALPLIEATQATEGEFPTYARGRLQTKVRQTLAVPASGESGSQS